MSYPYFIVIPALITDLNFAEKYLLGLIIALSQRGKNCEASNKELKTMMKISERHIKRLIKNLEKKGYITKQIKIQINKETTKQVRILSITTKAYPYLTRFNRAKKLYDI